MKKFRLFLVSSSNSKLQGCEIQKKEYALSLKKQQKCVIV